ncbi:hypothetical protein MN032_12895 [Agromyces atrinae]|uniref:hypothetical protein n=1 Tax=Agromyces atrinae TaxID=592376 RepID=UPI001F5A5C3E|nr:hypothetical protein [Agromyces atrinae]MCI2958593.1 hypothetical protein [Agromyces atrinae]
MTAAVIAVSGACVPVAAFAEEIVPVPSVQPAAETPAPEAPASETPAPETPAPETADDSLEPIDPSAPPSEVPAEDALDASEAPAPLEDDSPQPTPAPVEGDAPVPTDAPERAFSAHAAGTIGEQEPNNTTAQAQVLPLGSTLSGRFGPNGTCDNNFYDCDVYKITSPENGKLTLDLRFASTLGTEGSFAVTVLDASGRSTHRFDVRASDYSGAALRGKFISVPKGVSYIAIGARVQSFGGTPLWNNQTYTLKATVEKRIVEIEPNGATKTATPIGAGQVVYGATGNGDCNNNFYDCDVYRLSLGSATVVSVSFVASCSLATERPYRVRLLDNAGKVLQTKELGGPECSSGSTFSATAPAGNAYIEVYARAGRIADGLEYRLKAGGVLTASTPTIAGTGQQGTTLTAKPGAWGPGAVSLAYQWNRAGAPIAGATAASYKVTAADAKREISVTVTGTKGGYSPIARTSAKMLLPAAPVQQKLTTATPTISGATTEGAILTAAPGAWKPSPVTFAYQWKRDGAVISGATGAKYRITKADLGRALTVTVTGSKSGYTTASVTSAKKAIPRPATPQPQTFTTATPWISGGNRVGAVVTANTGTWKPVPTFRFQWYRNGAAIPGATADRYTLTPSDARATLKVTVIGSRSGYVSASTVSGDFGVSGSFGDTLGAVSTLPTNMYLESGNGRYRAVMQTDGNLVVYDNGRAIWANDRRGANASLTMQGDGNLVSYAGGRAIWATGTTGRGAVRLVMQNDGNLVLYTASGQAVWASRR